MPLTEAGKETLANFKKQYGKIEGKRKFYMSINSGRLKEEEMHKEKKK